MPINTVLLGNLKSKGVSVQCNYGIINHLIVLSFHLRNDLSRLVKMNIFKSCRNMRTR